MRKIIFNFVLGLWLTLPAYAFTIQDAVDIRYASEICHFPLTAKAKGLLKKFYRRNSSEFERLYAQYNGANVSDEYCPRLYRGFGTEIFGKPRTAPPLSEPIPAAEGAAPAGSLQGYAERCDLQLTDMAMKYLATARTAGSKSFNSAKSAAGQDPSPCEVIIGYFLKGGEMYGNFGFDVIDPPEPE